MSKRKKINAEERIRIAKACINGETSACAAADRVGVHSSVVDDWIRQYQEEGREAFQPRENNRRYDPVLKEAAVKAYLSGGGSLREICKQYKIRDKKQEQRLYQTSCQSAAHSQELAEASVPCQYAQ